MEMISKADKSDLQRILDLQYLAYQSEARLVNNFNIPPLKQTLEEVVSEYQKGTILKALNEKEEMIGSVRAYCKAGRVYIGKLFVHPDEQGKGIGTKLLLAIEQVYPHQKYELFTSTKSARNIKLYERLGYKVYKEKDVAGELKFVYLEK